MFSNNTVKNSCLSIFRTFKGGAQANEHNPSPATPLLQVWYHLLSMMALNCSILLSLPACHVEFLALQ